jgi:hypothetical protein
VELHAELLIGSEVTSFLGEEVVEERVNQALEASEACFWGLLFPISLMTAGP